MLLCGRCNFIYLEGLFFPLLLPLPGWGKKLGGREGFSNVVAFGGINDCYARLVFFFLVSLMERKEKSKKSSSCGFDSRNGRL